ncbi:hypothetical protein KIPB_010810, partial [Kipferlia bialata]|eukprot:g10810.t1
MSDQQNAPGAHAPTMAPVKHYDLFVIGAGVGLKIARACASDLGWSVGLAEVDKVVGTCLNRGCIPSKAFI